MRHESKEVAKGLSPNKTLEEAIKGLKDEYLKQCRSESFDIYRVNKEGVSSE